MKTLTSLFILLFTTNVAWSQISGGTGLITGTVGYHLRTVESDVTPGKTEESNLDFQLNGGYFLGDNFVLGLNIGYDMTETTSFISSQPDPVEQVTTTNIFTFGPFARYYHMFNDKAGFFSQADVGFGFGERSVQESPNVEITRLEAVLRPGMTFFFSDRWAVEGKFGYLGFKQDKEEYSNDVQTIETITTNVQVSFNFTTLSLGLAFYPGRSIE